MTSEVEIHLHDLLQQPRTRSETEEISFPGCHFSLCIGGHLCQTHTGFDTAVLH